MTLLDALKITLATELPNARYRVDAGEEPAPVHWLDFQGSLEGVSIEVRPSRGYGLHTGPAPGFGTGPDQVLTSPTAVVEALKALSIQ
jgi:hypothetical protein